MPLRHSDKPRHYCRKEPGKSKERVRKIIELRKISSEVWSDVFHYANSIPLKVVSARPIMERTRGRIDPTGISEQTRAVNQSHGGDMRSTDQHQRTRIGSTGRTRHALQFRPSVESWDSRAPICFDGNGGSVGSCLGCAFKGQTRSTDKSPPFR